MRNKLQQAILDKAREKLQPGDLVNMGRGTELVIGFWGHKVLVAPTGQDAPYSTRVGYCEAWPRHELVRSGWRAGRRKPASA